VKFEPIPAEQLKTPESLIQIAQKFQEKSMAIGNDEKERKKLEKEMKIKGDS